MEHISAHSGLSCVTSALPSELHVEAVSPAQPDSLDPHIMLSFITLLPTQSIAQISHCITTAVH